MIIYWQTLIETQQNKSFLLLPPSPHIHIQFAAICGYKVISNLRLLEPSFYDDSLAQQSCDQYLILRCLTNMNRDTRHYAVFNFMTKRSCQSSRIIVKAKAVHSLWWQVSLRACLPLCPVLPSGVPHPSHPGPSRKPRVWSRGARLSSGWWRTASCSCHARDWPSTGCPDPCAWCRSFRPQTCHRRWTCLLFHHCGWCHHPERTTGNFIRTFFIRQISTFLPTLTFVCSIMKHLRNTSVGQQSCIVVYVAVVAQLSAQWMKHQAENLHAGPHSVTYHGQRLRRDGM